MADTDDELARAMEASKLVYEEDREYNKRLADTLEASEQAAAEEREYNKRVADTLEASERARAAEREAAAAEEREYNKRVAETLEASRISFMLQAAPVSGQTGLVNIGGVSCYMIVSIQLLRMMAVACKRYDNTDLDVIDPQLRKLIFDRASDWDRAIFRSLFDKYMKTGDPGRQQDSSEFLINALDEGVPNALPPPLLPSQCTDWKYSLAEVLSSLSVKQPLEIKDCDSPLEYNNQYELEVKAGVRIILLPPFPARYATPKWSREIVDTDLMFDLGGALHAVVGFSLHAGNSMASGHYFCVGREANHDTWTVYDDRTVTPNVKGVDVFRGYDIETLKICAVLISPVGVMSGGARRMSLWPAAALGALTLFMAACQ
jgi:hypothetical protein